MNAFVAGVRAQTGAAEVDLIGHSEGGLVSRAYVKYEGAAEVTASSRSARRTTARRGGEHHPLLHARHLRRHHRCEQMTIGSTFLADLNAGDDSIGSVQYTNIATVVDEPAAVHHQLPDRRRRQHHQPHVAVGVLGPALRAPALIVDGAVYSGVQDVLAKRPIDFNCFAV